MDREHAQPVLRCERCGKPFDKQSTLKRHDYYCRSKKQSKASRLRSCMSCAKRKVRCDRGRPGCSRCLIEAIQCRYPDQTSEGLGPDPSLHQPTENTTTEGLLGNKNLVVPFPEFTNFDEGVYLGWDAPDVDLEGLLNLQTTEHPFQSTLPASPAGVPRSTACTGQAVQGGDSICFPSPLVPIQPTYQVRLITWRPNIEQVRQRTANLILHTLKSYPLMMLRHNTLPPFIHPRLISCGIEDTHLEPLNNCVSLVHMIGSGLPGCRKLFWKNVQMECERFCEEYLHFNKWGLLAAMQALSVYLIIRLDEGPTDHNNFDNLLVTAIKVVAEQLNTIKVTCDDDLETSWKEWIWEESIHRLCVVYQIVNMLAYFEPAAMCHLHDTNLVLAPLPAKKQLWEAPDMCAWKVESDKGHGARSDFALARSGELVRLDQLHLITSNNQGLNRKSRADNTASMPGRTTDWDEWCSGMDGFGGLIMLAASLAS